MEELWTIRHRMITTTVIITAIIIMEITTITITAEITAAAGTTIIRRITEDRCF